ncbi:phage tail tape measure protein [Streptomyces sp. NPDC057424]|uniref:phage tail tape measure protein n=1 Tax=Streptomyces sp. NPDC057424 TaxID=3346127 RepID=UPI00369284A6
MANVGYATLQIIPSVRGIGNEIRSQLIGPAEDAGEQAGQAAGGSLKEKLLIGAAAAGAAAGALLVAGITEAIDQANITSRLQAQLGATTKDGARYGKIAGELYAKGITETVEEGAEVIRSVINAGLVPPDATKKQLKAISSQMADVASTFGTDMSMQTQAVSAMMKNRLAPDAKSALDVITVGMQKLGPNADDLLETFQEYSVQMRKLGIDSEEALGLFRQGIKGGARDTDIIADAFKEFSILAVNMSDTSRDAYKALSLDAEKMEKQIGKGGDSAQRGLQTVLDKLRSMKDPVAREAAAVGLFGTQAEDLGAALFKLDPGKATSVMGDVKGAAADLGKTLHSGPGHEIEVFTRSLKQNFVNVIGGQVLPLVSSVARGFNAYLLPPLKGVSSVVIGVLVPALRGLWSAGVAVVGWLREMGTWLIPVGIAVGGLTAAILAQQIATAAVTAVFAIYRGAILAWTVVQRGATIAQAAFNAVMNANPVMLVITAIVALGAALYIAYQRSETFRSIVQAAWAGIQAAAMFAWNSVLKPAFAGLMVGLRALGAAFSWLWSSVIKPVFSFIDTAARILLTVITIVVFGPIYLAVKLLGAIFSWLWTNAIKPVVGWIRAGLAVLWAGAKVSFGLFMAGVRALGAVFSWLWRNAVKPALGFIVSGAKSAWSGAKIVFGYLTAGLRTVGGVFTWLWRRAVAPALAGVRSVLTTVWESGIRPVFDRLRAGTSRVAAAFETARKGIKLAWDKVSDIARKPVVFVVNTVYGKLRGVWNTVAGAFGAPKLPAYKFATGGVLPGYTPGRDVHLAALSGGEAVMRPEWTRAVGPGYVNFMNAAARSGGVAGVQRALGLPAFADGGIFGWVKSAASKGVDLAKSGVDWLKDGIKASALSGINGIVKPLINKIAGSASLYREMITRVPKKMISTILDFSGAADKKLEAAGIGGRGFKSALNFARSQAGKPYIWGGVGPKGYDCSGFMSAIENIIRGMKPYSRRWATGAFSGAIAPSGWVRGARSPFMVGITNAGVGHTAGTLNGTNVESRGGDGVVVGARARGYRDSLFTDWYGLKGYSKGTRGATPGWAWVGELGPELVRFGGGEEVLNHRDSLRFASTMGSLPGYAKGTSSAKLRAAARKQVPGDLTAVTKALTGSAADIKKAFGELVKDLKAAGGAGKTLAASSSKASAKLQALAKQRDSVDARLEAARSAATDQAKTAADFIGLSNESSAASVADLIMGMQQRQSTVKAFQGTIAGLSKRGLNQDLISQLVAMGPDSTLATLVASANKDQLAQLNKLAKSGAALSTSYGRTMADAMFDAGKNASKGFLTGLVSQEKELQAAMNKLAGGLVSSIKKKLKIKSPSRVTQWLGEMTGAGVGVGLDNTASTVAAAAARVADAAVPAVEPAASAGQGLTASGGALPRKIRLVVRDREFDAYLEEVADGRVDVAMTTLRRTVKARG